MNYIPEIIQYLTPKNILILGFGREGKSTFKFIREELPLKQITIADKNEMISSDPYVTLISGDEYLKDLNQYDLIFKTPGISLSHLNYPLDLTKVTSQTDIFLQWYGNQTIGITGTKGKSTTSSLIYHILKKLQYDVLLAGNIGIPVFDIIPNIKENSIIVAELSAHQLEFIHRSPHISVLLNLFQEHLDHFVTLEQYFNAKWNIGKKQTSKDYFIFCDDEPSILNGSLFQEIRAHKVPFSRTHQVSDGAYIEDNQIIMIDHEKIVKSFSLNHLSHLPGKHNLNNIMAALLATQAAGVSLENIEQSLSSFKGLEHRIEFVGKYGSIEYHNDSISTIPEATISALEALKNVDTLILGGFDRGIDYSILYNYLSENPVSNIALTGPAGRRMLQEWNPFGKGVQTVIVTDQYDEIIHFCKSQTRADGKCLLSPAAASFDQFKNFEERGTYFKTQIRQKS